MLLVLFWWTVSWSFVFCPSIWLVSNISQLWYDGECFFWYINNETISFCTLGMILGDFWGVAIIPTIGFAILYFFKFFCFLKCTLSPQHSTGKRRPPHGGVGAAVPAVSRHPPLHGFVLQGSAGSVCGAEGLWFWSGQGFEQVTYILYKKNWWGAFWKFYK